MKPDYILHLAEPDAWSDAQRTGHYRAASLDTEGFIHCAHPHQLRGVIQRYYTNRTDLILLTIDPARLTAELVEENTTGGDEQFPHIYGPINLDAIIEHAPATSRTTPQ